MADKRRAGAQKKSDQTRTRLMDSAAWVLKHRGYAGTRLSEIAERAGILPANIYYYFESKDALIEQVMHVGVVRGVETVQESVEALGPDASAEARLKAAITGHLRHNLMMDDYASATIRSLGHVPEPIRERQIAVERAYGRYWAKLIEDCQVAGSGRPDMHPSVVRMLMLGMLNWAVEWYRQGDRSPEQIAELAVDLFFNGFGTGPRALPGSQNAGKD